MPSKKERAKQRKAAKKSQQATNNNNINSSILRNNSDDVPEHYQAMPDSYIIEIVKLIKTGDHTATRALAESLGPISVVGSGILSAVLDFLNRCEDNTFSKVMGDIGGDMVSPKLWINVLLQADELEQSCRMQIAQNIGPLVRCMCADTKRVFFKSNKYWRESIVHFVDLITNMIHRANNERGDENNMIVDTLLEHEGLLRSIVQWGFWGEENRPDITKELGVEDRTVIVEWGRNAITQLMALVEVYKDGERTAVLTDDAKKRIDTIGTTPIVSKEYDPSCMISYTSGLIRIMKTVQWTNDDFVNLRNLTRCANCVDKGVIAEIIDFGSNYTTNWDTAEVVARIARDVILQKSNVENLGVLSDTRVAYAVRSGLIEMCLRLMEQFGMHESFGNDKQNTLSHNIAAIFTHVYSISLHMKSAKAIRRKKGQIEEKLMQLGRNKEISINDKCRELLDMVRSILDINGAYCCQCNKSLDKKGIKRCNGCNRMTYCSKACQREDWLNGGHNFACNKLVTEEQLGQFQGRCWPVREPESERDAEKLKALEINISMVQLKLFLGNSEAILNQARPLDIPLYDCIVHFDLRKCPLIVKVLRYNEFYESQEERRGFEEGRSKENITCLYSSSIFIGELLASGRTPVIAMQKFFSHEWLSRKL